MAFPLSLLSITDYSSSHGVIIDLYYPGQSFNISDYDVVVGLFNHSNIPHDYKIIGMNHGGFLYYLVLNPVRPKNNNISSPFTFRIIRLLLNKLINRRIIEGRATLYMSRGTYIPGLPGSPSYSIVTDIIRAFENIDTERIKDAAWKTLLNDGYYYNRTDGYWYYNGRIVEVRVIRKPMDPRADIIVDYVASVLRSIGFKPLIINVSMPNYLNLIVDSDPSKHSWDILPMACSIDPDKYSLLPAYLYSSWGFFKWVPGIYLPKISGNNTYVNNTIDNIIADLINEDRGSEGWITDYRRIVYLGLMESATIPVIYYPVILAVKNSVYNEAVIDPEYGFFSPRTIESLRSLRVAVITWNDFIDDVNIFTVFNIPDTIPYNILSWLTTSTPLTPDPIYGDLRGYAVKITSIENVINETVYRLDYSGKEWLRYTIDKALIRVIINVSSLGDPIDNSTDKILAKTHLSIYLAEYIASNPNKFINTYRIYAKAIKGFVGVNVRGSLLYLYYDSNKSIPEILYSINTLLEPAIHPAALIIATLYDKPSEIIPRFSPITANLLSNMDAAKLAELIDGINTPSTYEEYKGLFTIGEKTLLGINEWMDSLNNTAEWINEHGNAWITNGRYMIKNTTERHLELIPQREAITITSHAQLTMPNLQRVELRSIILNETVFPLLYAIIYSNTSLNNSLRDYIIGYVFVYNDTPVWVDSKIPLRLDRGANNISWIGPHTLLFSKSNIMLIEYSWKNYTQLVEVDNKPLVIWLTGNNTICLSGECLYKLLIVQNVSSIIEVLFNNNLLINRSLNHYYGVIYSIKINTSDLSDGEYNLYIRLIHDESVLVASNITLIIDVNPPIINAIVNIYPNSTLVIKWNISDYSGVRSAEIVLKGPISVKYHISSMGSIRLSLKPGIYTLTITARDKHGHVGSITRSFTISSAQMNTSSTNTTKPPEQHAGGYTVMALLLVLLLGLGIFTIVLLWWILKKHWSVSPRT